MAPPFDRRAPQPPAPIRRRAALRTAVLALSASGALALALAACGPQPTVVPCDPNVAPPAGETCLCDQPEDAGADGGNGCRLIYGSSTYDAGTLGAGDGGAPDA